MEIVVEHFNFLNMDFSCMHRKKLLIVFLFSSFFCFAQLPNGYYDDAEGRSGAELKTALHNTIRNHIILNYNSSTYTWWYDYFAQTDWHSGGYFWDMYSNDRYSNYNGSRQNREHCMPRSWWGTSEDYSSFDANGDLHNLYPSNANANEAKSNLPLGEVRTGGETYNNGVVKVGESGFSGYIKSVFEPADEYKGDFARTYMYMVTCYEDYSNNWRGVGTQSMLQRNNYPTFTSYAVNLLIQWHTQDPVSEKEIERNNAVYRIQNNRNPFIDHPKFAYLIWAPNTKIDFSLAVYPNPVTDEFTLEFTDTDFDKINYAIYSVNGILMQQQELSVGDKISVNTLNNGLYLLVVYAGNKRFSEKIIINK